ncbi:MAG: sugar phosphate isomerase/epimerase [Actinomycetota bacterium]|nr:sugar phosphate isomerase/epimerase [Actinomycetota bacterium]
MWAQQPRFAEGLGPFSQVAQGAGYVGIEVSHLTDLGGFESLLNQSVLPVHSLHAPTPRPAAAARGLNLAATDEDERAAAVGSTVRTMDYAVRVGARFVVVHLGHISERLDEEDQLRRFFQQGRIESDEARATRDQAHRRRRELVGPHLTAAQRSLAELAEAASARGVAIGLENRLGFREIPSPEETALLLADYPPGLVGYWHDTGHLEVQGRLGLLDRQEALDSLGARILGTHLHDVQGLRDHRAPGNGESDWAYIARALPPAAVRTFEISGDEPETFIQGAIGFLARCGIL